MTTKILVLAGSIRPGSFNARLAERAVRSIEAQGGDATRLDLGQYPLPIYDAELEAAGIPDEVLALHALFASHDGVFIASPEYNSFPPPLLLNMLDWLSRVRHYEGGMVEAFERPAFAISSASPAPLGGYRGLIALRHKLELGLGATVMPAMASVMSAYAGFDDDGNIIDERNAAMLEKAVSQLLAAAARA
ncbi:NADPH-dependent FMN reductase [Sphingopyxis sp. GC21]|uniref:NADPH-dependent FMN reductase n=1 Tax=Sphingopyxis sp. GC21 TaxID=2933562 RepID=UPI0021E4B445|nr:NAD(P)H-dependent oxidoreductase [Sphingopyxis sp. GC21]